MFDIFKFVETPIIKDSFQVLENGTILQFLIDEISFELKKIGGKLEVKKGKVARPFLIIKATSKALDFLSSADNAAGFGKRFAKLYNQKSINIILMAPPGTALSYGVLTMLSHMGIKPNLL